MIARIWRGWTTHADAAAYDALLREEVFAGIAGRRIDGYRAIELCVGPTATSSSSSPSARRPD